ncbi:myosin heavy chain, clone 203-like [Palaemon carinicauda]|uniref:myosin heavy chain, clone 203-like n=1 Tax=Palaemon carinicauda TaxID=392227 RepID=UPI0035B59850
MERLQAAAYNGANLLAGESMVHTETEEESENDPSEELDEAEDGIQQETEKVSDLQNTSQELEDAKVGEIEFSNNNLANIALEDDLERANRNIESLMASVENELEKAYEEIRILEKKLEGATGDLKTAKEKLLEKRHLEEYVESAASYRTATVAVASSCSRSKQQMQQAGAAVSKSSSSYQEQQQQQLPRVAAAAASKSRSRYHE